MEFKDLEARRKKSATLVTIAIVLGVVSFLIFFFLYETPFLGVITLIPALICLAVGYAWFGKLSKEFKTVFLRNLVKETFEEAEYYPDKGVNVNDVYNSDLVMKADRHHTEDLIIGKADGVAFKTSDVKLEERRVRQTKNGTQVYYVTYFLGRFFEFEFPKEFKSKILVSEGGIMSWFSGYKKIELESIEFNKKFKTYTKNEHDAFYVLTPHLMESIMKLEKQNPGSLGLTFFGKKLYILINNNINTFELKLYSPIDIGVIKQLERDLQVIKQLIHELKLNRKIFID